MWWNKSNDASLAVAFVAAYAIKLHVVYSTFGLSENLEQLVYPFSFLLKKKASVPCDSGLVKVWRQSLCWNEKNRPHNLPPAAPIRKKKNKENEKETTDWGNFFFIFSVVFLVWANTSYPRYDVYIVI